MWCLKHKNETQNDFSKNTIAQLLFVYFIYKVFGQILAILWFAHG